MKKKYKCIIFDLDGTLINTQRMNIVPLQRLIKEELGHEISYEELLKYRGYAGMETIKMLKFSNPEEAYKKWVKYVNEFEEGAVLYDGFNKVIRKLHKNGVLCGIASSKMKNQYKIDFMPTGLHTYMKTVILAEDTIKHKPHPEPLLKALEQMGVTGCEALYVGDTLFDYESAKAAGMDFALATWGATEIEGINAAYKLYNATDVLTVFDME